MKMKWFVIPLIIITFSVVLACPSWGGQVVTQDTRSWAKNALQEEKSLQAVTGENTLAVLYFQNITGQADLDPLQKGMALMLITDLSKVEGIQVIERIKLQALVDEMRLGESGLMVPETSSRLGKLLRAQWLVGGKIEGKKTQLQIQSSPLDVPSQTILGQPMTTGQLNELFEMEKKLLFEIIDLLKIKLTPEQEAELKKPCTKNMEALIALSKAIDASDRGDYAAAEEYYKKALKEDPNVCLARDSLSELKSLGLIAVKKKGAELLKSIREQTSQTNQLTPTEQQKYVPSPGSIQPRTDVDIDITFPK